MGRRSEVERKESFCDKDVGGGRWESGKGSGNKNGKGKAEWREMVELTRQRNWRWEERGREDLE